MSERVILYTRRYFMLFLFCTLNFMQSFQWLQYSIITNIIKRFYDVTDNDVNWTSVICFLVMVPLMIPCTWILEKIGVRNYLLLGAAFNWIGAIIKCYSLKPDLFWVALFGQVFSGLSAPFIQPISPQLARIWFPKEKISRATGIGVFSMFFGNMCASIIPVVLVPDSRRKNAIRLGLNYLFVGQAVIATIMLILVLLFFEEKPKTPPSLSEANAYVERRTDSYLKSMKAVLNRNIIILLFVYAMCGAESNSLLTVLNQMILKRFKHQVHLVGITGFLVSGGSMMSTFVMGYVLDKTNYHKALIFTTYGLSALLFFVLSFSLIINSDVLLLITATVLGFTVNSYPTIVFNFAAELTYPEPEGVSSSLLVLNSQILSSVFTFFVSDLINKFGVFVSNAFYSTNLVAAMILTVFVKNDLRRQRVENESSHLLS